MKIIRQTKGTMNSMIAVSELTVNPMERVVVPVGMLISGSSMGCS